MSPSPERRREYYGLYPLCSGQLYPTEEAKVATQMSYLGSHGILYGNVYCLRDLELTNSRMGQMVDILIRSKET